MPDTALTGLGGSQVNCAFCRFKSANGLRIDLALPTMNDSLKWGMLHKKLCRTCDLNAEEG